MQHATDNPHPATDHDLADEHNVDDVAARHDIIGPRTDVHVFVGTELADHDHAVIDATLEHFGITIDDRARDVHRAVIRDAATTTAHVVSGRRCPGRPDRGSAIGLRSV